MQLPVGVYAVCQSFAQTGEPVTFSFQGQEYSAEVGRNAFAYLEDLENATLIPADKSFCGYRDVPVIIMPAGIYKAGTLQPSRFRTYLPCEMAILGENAGIRPNGADLRTAAPRREETVIRGSFYFGCIALKNGVEGTLTLDGLTFESCKIFDERTEAVSAGLTLRNCRFTGALYYDLIRAFPMVSGHRLTRLEDCRADGLGACFGEGRLLNIGSGSAVVQRLYFGNTDKFPGLTNYSRSDSSHITELSLKDCLFENCGSVHGISIVLPEESEAAVTLQNCHFMNFAPQDDPALWIRMSQKSRLQLLGCSFTGSHDAPAVEIAGNAENAVFTDCSQAGYSQLFSPAKPRRTAVDPTGSYPLTDPHQPVAESLAPLDAAYENRKVFYCDFHCHSNSGGTSDGKTPIEEYVAGMDRLGVDCAAIVDHRQMRHFFLPCWDEKKMICGTEPSARIAGRPAAMDYTMIFPDKTGLAQVMDAFPEYAYTGGIEGNYRYTGFTLERFRELGEFIYGIGGLLSHAHPMQLPGSGDPSDYFFSEHIATETVHVDVNAFATRQNHILWTGMLQQGKRVRTHGSSDSHGPVSNRGLTTVYAEDHDSAAIFRQIRSGNCTAGGVGIRMCIDSCPMGSSLPYQDGRRLYLRVADFHFAHHKPDTVYALKVYTDAGLAYVQEFDGRDPIALVLPVKTRRFYRCEVWNESDRLPVAFSNPIWLD